MSHYLEGHATRVEYISHTIDGIFKKLSIEDNYDEQIKIISEILELKKSKKENQS